MIPLTTLEQIELFAGIEYDIVRNRVVLPNGTALDKKRFNVLFGGLEFVLGVDTTRSAWIAFTRNPGFRPPYRTQPGHAPLVN